MRIKNPLTKRFEFHCDACGVSVKDSNFHFCDQCHDSKVIKEDRILKMMSEAEENAWRALGLAQFYLFTMNMGRWRTLNKLLRQQLNSPFSVISALGDEKLRKLFLKWLKARKAMQ